MLLAGCASQSTHEIVSSRDRQRIAAEIMDANWVPIAAEFPDAEQPVVVVTRTINDNDWAATMVSCLRDTGINAVVRGDGFSYSAPAEFSASQIAVSRYVCDSTTPTATDVTRYLNRVQLDALYRYYVGSVRPCLLVAGMPSPRPPTWFSFVTGALSRPVWHPFNLVWQSRPEQTVRYLEERCPPVPPWLDLGR